MSVRKDILWRVYIAFGFVALLGMAVISRTAYVQLGQGAYWQHRADSLGTKMRTIEAVRGNIYAADGSLLATSVPEYEIRFDVASHNFSNEEFEHSVDSLGVGLAGLFGEKTPREYATMLRQQRAAKTHYLLLKRDADFQQLKALRGMPIFRLGRYKGGLIVVPKTRREMPFDNLALRTIGYQVKGVANVGVEGAFNSYLSGLGGERLMQKVAGGVWVPISNGPEFEPKPGRDVVTTLDVNMQDVAETALLRALQAHQADHGCAILMETATGKIKAIANLGLEKDGTYTEKYNYAIGEAAEPGSTFKLASMIVGLEEGAFNIQDTIYVGNGEWYWTKGHSLPDSHKPEHSVLTLQRAFETSSNVGISRAIVKAFGRHPNDYLNGLNRLHLNRKLHLQIPGEGNMRIKDTDDPMWSPTSLPYMSVGYEVRLTPMQTLTLYNAVANRGKMVKPYFVEEVRELGRPVKRFGTEVIDAQICSERTLRSVRTLLEGVVERGTASKCRTNQYKIAGKTGTAQVADGNKGYLKDERVYQSSFAGYFPAENPRYSCIVVIKNARIGYSGAEVAAPVFREISDQVFASLLDVQPQRNDSIKQKYKAPIMSASAGNRQDMARVLTTLNVRYQDVDEAEWVGTAPAPKDSMRLTQRTTRQGIVPDVTGMGLQDALYLLEEQGLRVRVRGQGRVMSQSVKPGSAAKHRQEVIIQLT